ncbi:type IV pilin biogenesis protein [Spirochaetia bacterium]|nr:type IV pilin biogenesis protein [Spirochaetia bacterium]
MSRNSRTIQFVDMLHSLVKGNTGLVDALHILAGKGIDPAVRICAQKIRAVMEKGRSFSDGLEAVSGGAVYFAPLYRTLINAAENTGTINTVLEVILADLKRKQQARENLLGVMVYPAIIITIAFAGTLVLLFKGIPMFIEAGLVTEAVVDSAVSGIAAAGIFLFITGGVLFAVYYQIFGRDSPENKVFYLLSFLLQNNISVHDALSQCIASVGVSKHGKALVSIKKDNESGVRLPEAFGKHPVFPAYISGWLAIAGENGNMAGVCGTIYAHFQERDARVRAIAAKCIEPAIIIITGIYLLIVIQAVILPILTRAGGIL